MGWCRKSPTRFLNGHWGRRRVDLSVIIWGGQCWSIASTLQSSLSERLNEATGNSRQETQKCFKNGQKCLLVRHLDLSVYEAEDWEVTCLWHIYLLRQKIMDMKGLCNLVEEGIIRTKGWSLKPDEFKLKIRRTLLMLIAISYQNTL